MQGRQCTASEHLAATMDLNGLGPNPTLGQGALLTDLNARQSIFLITNKEYHFKAIQ